MSPHQTLCASLDLALEICRILAFQESHERLFFTYGAGLERESCELYACSAREGSRAAGPGRQTRPYIVQNYIYFFIMILQKYMVRFAKIYICRRDPRR
jgi:hypothetical protein